MKSVRAFLLPAIAIGSSALLLSPIAQAAQAGALSYAEFKRLPRAMKREVIDSYVRFMIEYENKHPVGVAAAKPAAGTQVAEQIAEWMDWTLEKCELFPQAFAAASCINAGSVGTRTGGRCQQPSDLRQMSCASGTSGSVRCEPAAYGGFGDSAICIKPASNNYSQQCRSTANQLSSSSGYKGPDDPAYAARQEKWQSDINQIPDAHKDADIRNTALLARKELSKTGGTQTAGAPGGNGGNLGESGIRPTNAGEQAMAQGNGATRTDGTQGKPPVVGGGVPPANPPGKSGGDGTQGPGGTQVQSDTDQARLDRQSADLQASYDKQKAQLEAAAKKKMKVDNDVGGAQYFKESDHDITDHCKYSSALDKAKYGCDDTRNFVEGAEVGNAVAQMGAQLTTSVQGARAQMTASQSGTQSDALKGAADLQSSAAMMQMGIGAVNAAAGAYQIYLAQQHKAHHKEIRGELVDKKGGLVRESDATNTNYKNQGANSGEHGYVQASNELGKRVIEGQNGTQYFGDMNAAFALRTTITLSEPQVQERKKALADPNTNASIRMRYEHDLKVHSMQLQAREDEIKTKKLTAMKQEVAVIGGRAASEQDETRKMAMGGGMKSLTTGVGMLANGMLNNMAADQLSQAADKLKNIEGSQIPFKPSEPTIIGAGDALAPRTATTISGNGSGSEVAAAESSEEKGAGDTLGGPMNLAPNPSGLKDPAPVAAKFMGKDPSEAKGGGGGPMGGGGTSPASGTGEDPQARLADNRGSFAYEGGGGGYQGGGGGGAGGGDKGPDLSGMLAQFLPKKDDEGGNKNGILDFGGRAPAAADDNGSLLDRKANIFDRIHQTYQEKQKRKFIGI